MLLSRVKEELKITFDDQDTYLEGLISDVKDEINHTIMTLDEVDSEIYSDYLDKDKTYNSLVLSKAVYNFRKSQDNANKLTNKNPHDYFQKISILATKMSKLRGVADGFEQVEQNRF